MVGRRDPTITLGVSWGDFLPADWASRCPVQSLDEAVEMHKLLVAVQHHRKNSLDVVPAAATFPQGLARRRVVYTPMLLGIPVPVDGKVPSSLKLGENRTLSNSPIVRHPEGELKGSSSHTDAVLSWGVVSDMLDGGVR